MPCFQLRYLGARAACEIVDADDVDEAEDLARMRLLFHEPGFVIAVVFEGVELSRVIQRPKRSGLARAHSGWIAMSPDDLSSPSPTGL
jgi:hypothetical protein